MDNYNKNSCKYYKNFRHNKSYFLIPILYFPCHFNSSVFFFLMDTSQPTTSITTQIYQIQIQQIQHTPITKVNSYSATNDRQFLLICTQTGIVVVNNPQFTFKCYENQNGPFYIDANNSTQQIGVKIGSLVRNRNQAAVVPNFNSRFFDEKHCYIFDYEMKCLLHSVDFFLAIQQIFITQQQIFVSNKKRVVVYNYLNDSDKKSQKYYLDMYVSKQMNNSLRYFETFCEDYQDPYTINQIMQVRDSNCLCGKFYLSAEKPFVLAYIQTISLHTQCKRKIWIYNQKYDSHKYFEENLPNENPFEMALSPDGQFLAYTFNYGKKINVYNLKQNCLYCVLYVSSKIKDILKMQIFRTKIGGKVQNCLCIIRKSNLSTATLHIFKILKKSPTQQIKSQYRRYFPLYEKTFKDYGISQTLINPGLFMKNNVLYVFSICGMIFVAIDFQHTGNWQEKIFDVYHTKWTQQKQNNA